jgi:hypothetical protein
MLSLPPVLILKYVGNETSVGVISSVSYAIAITIVYLVSKRSGVQHRTRIIKFGAIFLFIGSLFFSFFLFSAPMISTAILMGVYFICDPVLNFPFRATFMKAMDEIKHRENRDDYAYVVDVEIFTAIGRVVSIGFFFLMYVFIPLEYALSIFAAFIAISQFAMLKFSREINGY